MFFLIFTIILLIAMFAYTFSKMIKNNFIDYVYVLVAEFVGIAIMFLLILLGKSPSILVYTLVYFISICIPILFMMLERKGVYISELKLTLFRNKVGKEDILSVLNKNPNSYLGHQMLAEYYEKNNENEKAEDEYYKLIDLKPEEEENYIKLANLLHEDKKNKEASEVLQHLLDIKPDQTKASIMLAGILYDNNKFKEAIIVLNHGLKYNPKEYELYYYLGMTYTRLNDFNNAKECYQKAATINSIQDIANLNIGQIYLIFEEYDKAEEYFFKTLESDDDVVLANSYFYLAKIKLINENIEQAIQYLNLAIECDPAIIKRIRQDEIFAETWNKIIFKTKDSINTKLTTKDIQTMNHLGKTFNLVENLTNNSGREGKNKEQEKL